ncbi:MAG: ABC transporter permease [Acidobacteriota bacterium]|nr:ABC transporter permease [Acidobacteriota bacterium]
MKLAWAFFKRDAIIAFSYRISFAVSLLEVVTILGVFYYIGKTIGQQNLPVLERYGGSFLAFLLIGIALTDCVGVSLTTFAQQIREGQMTGTLEATLMSPVALARILVYSSLWAYAFSALRLILYLGLGGLLYGVGLGHANLLSATAIFILTILCFMGVGMFWAGVVLLIKRGEAIMHLLGYVVILVSGVLFPRGVLPAWVQRVGEMVPMTHALEGMRLALLQGRSVGELAPVFWKLMAFAVALQIIGIAGFNAAVKISKTGGSLAEY